MDSVTNKERAERLAKVFGWKIDDGMISGVEWSDFPKWVDGGFFHWTSPLFGWLMLELPKRGMAPFVAWSTDKQMFCAEARIGLGSIYNADPLLALVDATLAAMGEKS